MSENVVRLTVDIRGMERLRLLQWELEALRSRMVLVADPFATELDHILERFAAEQITTCSGCDETYPGLGSLTHHQDGTHTFEPADSTEDPT